MTRRRALCWSVERPLCVRPGAAGACNAPGDRLALGDGDGAGRELQLAAVAAQLHRGRVGAEGQHQGRGAGKRNAHSALRARPGATGVNHRLEHHGSREAGHLRAARTLAHASTQRVSPQARQWGARVPTDAPFPAKQVGKDSPLHFPLCHGSIHNLHPATPPPQQPASLVAGALRIARRVCQVLCGLPCARTFCRDATGATATRAEATRVLGAATRTPVKEVVASMVCVLDGGNLRRRRHVIAIS